MHNELFEKSDEREEVSLKNAKIFLGVNNPKQHPFDPFFYRAVNQKIRQQEKSSTEERVIFSFFERQTTDFERNFCERESF